MLRLVTKLLRRESGETPGTYAMCVAFGFFLAALILPIFGVHPEKLFEGIAETFRLR